MAAKKKTGNEAVKKLSEFLDHIERTYGKGVLCSVSQSEFTEELLIFLWKRGYKVVPLEQEDYDAN